MHHARTQAGHGAGAPRCCHPAASLSTDAWHLWIDSEALDTGAPPYVTGCCSFHGTVMEMHRWHLASSLEKARLPCKS